MSNQKKTQYWDPFLKQISLTKAQWLIEEPTALSMKQKLCIGTGCAGIIWIIFFSIVGPKDLAALGILITIASGFAYSHTTPSESSDKGLKKFDKDFFDLSESAGWGFRISNEAIVKNIRLPKAGRHIPLQTVREAAINIFDDKTPELIIPDQQIEAIAEQSSKSSKNKQISFDDPFYFRAVAKLEQLLAPTRGSPMPLIPRVMSWGTLNQNTPFWLSMQVSKATMAMPSKDTRGADHSVGFVIGLPLARDIRINALIKMEALRRDTADFDTESTQFNELFNISILDKSRTENADVLALMQVLTPATQTTLIDLNERLNAELMIVDNTLFIKGMTFLNLAHSNEIETLLNSITSELASGALALKRYTE